MKYKIGEVSKILNIPIETLRYLEKMDIVHPKKDDSNNYRYYDAWDINFLIEYKRFRSYDFSSSQVEEILHSDNMESFKDKVRERQHYIDDKLKYYTLLKRKHQEYICVLENIEASLGKFTFAIHPDIYYFTHRSNYQYETKDKFEGIFEAWMNHLPFVEPLVVMPYDAILNRNNTNKYNWGFSIEKEYADAFNIPINERVIHIENVQSVHTVICAGKRGTFSLKLLDSALDFIKNNGYILSGDVVGRLLARVHEPVAYCRYIEIWMPVEKV
ncbi:MAG: MerR family transcriptional regulator [Eubacteriaceae bacterium]|nr:MerR family transcriptional regulator [Eubacteriaceae bacterium]